MGKLRLLLLLIPLILLLSCTSGIPSWIEENKHAISTDGKALAYESILEGNRISVTTWVKSNLGSGGEGVFDIQTNDSSGVNMIWISDSTILIEYPSDSKVLMQEDSTFFAGRIIKLLYKVKK